MALAKYEGTKQGSSIKASNKSTSFEIPSTSSAGRIESAISSAVSKKQSSDQSVYFKNLKNAYLKGNIGTTEYYSTLSSSYDKLASVEKDESKRMGYENSSLTARASAISAAESAGRKAESAEKRAINVQKSEITAMVFQMEQNIEKNLGDGKYASAAEYLKEKKNIYTAEHDSYVAMANDPANDKADEDRFKAESMENALMDTNSKAYSGPASKYLSLNLKLEHPERQVVVQRYNQDYDTMKFEVDNIGNTEGKSEITKFGGAGSSSSDYVRAESGVWIEKTPLVVQSKDAYSGIPTYFRLDQQTGEYKKADNNDPNLTADMGKGVIMTMDKETGTKQIWEKSQQPEIVNGQEKYKWRVMGTDIVADSPAIRLTPEVVQPGPTKMYAALRGSDEGKKAIRETTMLNRGIAPSELRQATEDESKRATENMFSDKSPVKPQISDAKFNMVNPAIAAAGMPMPETKQPETTDIWSAAQSKSSSWGGFKSWAKSLMN